MRRRKKCESCQGQGLFVPAQPSCRINAKRRNWLVVERCDTCDQYPDDLSAALTRYRVAGWFQCQDGGWHALAQTSSRLRL